MNSHAKNHSQNIVERVPIIKIVMNNGFRAPFFRAIIPYIVPTIPDIYIPPIQNIAIGGKSIPSNGLHANSGDANLGIKYTRRLKTM